MINDLEKRAFLVKNTYKLGSYEAARRVYKTEYKCKVAPSICCIKNIISTFEKNWYSR